ncbi:unnamed protein product [Lactuca saligna]|uniref:Uncharacterized protein n=1 Tax=Lactuca saligna TaxID=75948 RepID=A0AA36E4Q0_LACSI|nr:unnamed protein product [Lactuca saligna]
MITTTAIITTAVTTTTAPQLPPPPLPLSPPPPQSSPPPPLPNSAEDYNIFSQLTKTINTQRNDPVASSLPKRRKPKPIRFEVSPTEVQTERPPPKINIPVSKTSTPSLRPV